MTSSNDLDFAEYSDEVCSLVSSVSQPVEMEYRARMTICEIKRLRARGILFPHRYFITALMYPPHSSRSMSAFLDRVRYYILPLYDESTDYESAMREVREELYRAMEATYVTENDDECSVMGRYALAIAFACAQLARDLVARASARASVDAALAHACVCVSILMQLSVHRGSVTCATFAKCAFEKAIIDDYVRNKRDCERSEVRERMRKSINAICAALLERADHI